MKTQNKRHTAVIKKECENRLRIVLNGAQSAIFAIEHMNPKLASNCIDDIRLYGELAKLDAEELVRRINTPVAII